MKTIFSENQNVKRCSRKANFDEAYFRQYSKAFLNFRFRTFIEFEAVCQIHKKFEIQTFIVNKPKIIQNDDQMFIKKEQKLEKTSNIRKTVRTL